MITAQEVFDLYGKDRTKEERLEYISAKILSICGEETSLEIPFLSEYEIQVLKDKGFDVKAVKQVMVVRGYYYVISWDMESWKHW